MAKKTKAEEIDLNDNSGHGEGHEKVQGINRTVSGIQGDFSIKITEEKIRIYERDEDGLDTLVRINQPDHVEEIEIVREGDVISVNFK